MAETVTVTEPQGFAAATVMARRGVGADAVGAALGLALTSGAAWSRGSDLALIGTGPGTWLALAATAPPTSAWPEELGRRLAGLAAVSDQSGAYLIYGVSGPSARRLLERGVFLDLDPAAFGPGAAATTVIAHVGVILWRESDDEAAFHVAVPRSFGGSFRHWLDAAPGQAVEAVVS